MHSLQSTMHATSNLTSSDCTPTVHSYMTVTNITEGVRQVTSKLFSDYDQLVIQHNTLAYIISIK